MPDDKQSFMEQAASGKLNTVNPYQTWRNYNKGDRWKTIGYSLPPENLEMLEFIALACHTTKSSLTRNIIKTRIAQALGGESVETWYERRARMKDKREFGRRLWEFLTKVEGEEK